VEPPDLNGSPDLCFADISQPHEGAGMTARVNSQQLQERVQSGKRILIDFYADWCGPCKAVAPAVARMAQERTDLEVLKVNIDEEPQAAAKFGVRSIPTLTLVEGGDVAAVKVGALSYGQLADWVRKTFD
jgi:thioredoxin 1